MAARRRAKRQLVAELDGKAVVVLEGATLPASDPLVKANPGYFDAATPRKARARKARGKR